MKNLINRLLSPLGLGSAKEPASKKEPDYFQEIDELFRFILERNGGGRSQAQLSQDVFALLACGMKKDGYFVEFGATNGVDLSNSLLLEKDYDWSGILVEPDPRWQEEIRRNRSCIIDTRCVWKESGKQLDFSMAPEGEYSTISHFQFTGIHAEKLENASDTIVETVSLLDLLNEHAAPSNIDYLSIDTEGSECEILRSFDFSNYQFEVISIEHNFTDSREEIFSILCEEGYRRVFSRASRWDDWYVRS